MSKYVVLQLNEDTEDWQRVGEYEASTPNAAILAVLNGVAAGAASGTFVTAPARSWKPVKVQPETKLTFS